MSDTYERAGSSVEVRRHFWVFAGLWTTAVIGAIGWQWTQWHTDARQPAPRQTVATRPSAQRALPRRSLSTHPAFMIRQAAAHGGIWLLGMGGIALILRSFRQRILVLQETERKLAAARDALERRIVERTAELEQTNRELQSEIAERRLAEQWLLESEERFRSYFELGLVGMAIVSPEKEWLEVNRRLCQILGYSEFELLHKKWEDLTHPEDRHTDAKHLDQVLAGITTGYSIDRRFLGKHGEVVDAHLCVRRFHRADGSVDSLLVLVQDITQRKQAEETLRRSREFLLSVIDAVPESTLVIDHDYRVVLANRAARQWRGGADPVEGRMTCYHFLHHCSEPCDEDTQPCPLKQVRRRKAPLKVVQTLRDSQGAERIVEMTAVPIFNDAGEVVQIVKSSHDVTDHRRAEAEVAAAKAAVAQVAAWSGGRDQIAVLDGGSGVSAEDVRISKAPAGTP
ncbi:MAG: PAS domain S-box protein [Pirellulales bacterium]|nr:PAS domain S-box protein [Pirellulales bacterium]